MLVFVSFPSQYIDAAVGAGRVTQRWHGEADFGDGAVDEYYDHSPGSLRAEDPAHRKYGSPGSSRTEDQYLVLLVDVPSSSCSRQLYFVFLRLPVGEWGDGTRG